ncbi:MULTISPECIES: DUF1415 domain-containing protein [unclassified Iodobacter]|uniref:DUF1415 domain-containing protein n=1 Tax=unclassified Iodobacter TaxID=235634 RepID=UPI0025F7FEF0|nr:MULTISPECIES: DUF1415 domain-containing protein [unclassified Iodobacter]MDW5416066.1 DUF1415 domain-containing protein [Iodobacter sp. CM08]
MTLPTHQQIIQETERWLTTAVIGLNLCPFAKAVHVKKQIRYVLSEARNIDVLIEILITELETLAAADPAEIETTLLIHPYVLGNFLAYNDFLEIADSLLEELNLEGVLQIASFHPQYQFEGSAPDDIDNYTNRSPYPTLHLIREESIAKVEADADVIVERNIANLRAMGLAGWKKLWE